MIWEIIVKSSYTYLAIVLTMVGIHEEQIKKTI